MRNFYIFMWAQAEQDDTTHQSYVSVLAQWIPNWRTQSVAQYLHMIMLVFLHLEFDAILRGLRYMYRSPDRVCSLKNVDTASLRDIALRICVNSTFYIGYFAFKKSTIPVLNDKQRLMDASHFPPEIFSYARLVYWTQRTVTFMKWIPVWCFHLLG